MAKRARQSRSGMAVWGNGAEHLYPWRVEWMGEVPAGIIWMSGDWGSREELTRWVESGRD
jgi:hypothetical protein